MLWLLNEYLSMGETELVWMQVGEPEMIQKENKVAL